MSTPRPLREDQPRERRLEPVAERTPLTPRRNLGAQLFIATRPRQWVKNVLVFAAPAAAGRLARPEVLGRTALAAVLFVVASAGVYLVNDVVDVAHDRAHPEKSKRPIASGAVPLRMASLVGAALLAVALAGSLAVAGVQLLAVLACYIAVSLAYTLSLKHVAVVDLACVSSGFVLRAVAGGAANHLAISPWFTIVTSSGALLLVAGKRSAELALLGAKGAAHRRVLATYTPAFLRMVRTLAATVAVMSYSLWAFNRTAQLHLGRGDFDDILLELSIVPFALVILMIELAIEAGRGGAPEEIALGDRAVQLLGAACLALVAIGVYG